MVETTKQTKIVFERIIEETNQLITKIDQHFINLTDFCRAFLK